MKTVVILSLLLLQYRISLTAQDFAPAPAPAPAPAGRVAGVPDPPALSPKTPPPSILARPSHLPLIFEPNRGQTDSEVRYLARGSGYTLFLTDAEAVIAPRNGDAVRMRLAGANRHASLEGLEPTGGISNYFHGRDPKQWHTNIPHFKKALYRDVYPGIDEVFYGDNGKLEYDIVVSPGADPSLITMEYSGAHSLRVDERGDLELATATGNLHIARPTVYQFDDIGGRKTVEASFRLNGTKRASILLARYDHGRRLIIDPTVTYATYLGGSGTESGNGITLDSDGNIYVSGGTTSADFPILNPFQSKLRTSEAYVTKLNPAATAILYSTFIGGSLGDNALAIGIDKSRNIVIMGNTSSKDFPVQNAFQPVFPGDSEASFIARLDSTGSHLVYATYFGRFSGDIYAIYPNMFAVDSAGNAYLCGKWPDSGLPVKNPIYSPKSTPSGGSFLSKFAPDGTLAQSMYLDGADSVRALTLDASDNVYVTGEANFFSTIPFRGGFQPTGSGSSDAYVIKFDAAGTKIVYAIRYGGDRTDEGRALAVDRSGNLYMAGQTASTALPLKNALFTTRSTGFIAKVSPDGSALLYASYFIPDVRCITVDGSGNIHLSGTISGSGAATLPLKNALVSAFETSSAFLTGFAADGASLLYSTFIASNSYASQIAIDAGGNVNLFGAISTQSLPAAPAGLQSKIQGGGDAFLIKVAPVSPAPATVNAASFRAGAPVAPNSIASVFGDHLGIQTISATDTLRTTLGGTTVTLTDSSGRSQLVSLFFVGLSQVNFLVPADAASGLGQLQITAGDGIRSVGPIQISNAAPGIFTADGFLPVGTVLQVNAQGGITSRDLLRYDAASGKFSTPSIDLGASGTNTYLILYGTGIRLALSSQISVTIGGQTVSPAFAGIQGDFAGLDQINVLIPRSLAGTGDVPITLTAAGAVSNTVHVAVQ
jgi:uncharacterized protein (TIGR03437 family)